MSVHTVSRGLCDTEQGKLSDPMIEHFAQLVANGASYTQAVKIADPDRPAPHNQGARWAKLPKVAARIAEIASTALVASDVPKGIAEITDRIAVVSVKWRGIEDIFACRGAEYEELYPEVAGGHTGYFHWEEKVFGDGDVRKVHRVDYKLLQESRELLRLAHEWDKRNGSIKALHLHQHQHAASPADAKVKALPDVDLERIVNIAESAIEKEPKP